MARTFQFHLVAPESLPMNEEITSVILPGAIGEFEVLAQHMPFISSLNPGTLVITKNEEKEFYFIAGGYVEVNLSSVVVLAEEYEKSDKIDVERSMLSKKSAEEKMASKAEGINMMKEKHVIARNEARLDTVRKATAYKK